MTGTTKREQFRAVFLATIMLLSVVAMGVGGFAGVAAAEETDTEISGLTVDDVVGSDEEQELTFDVDEIRGGEADGPADALLIDYQDDSEIGVEDVETGDVTVTVDPDGDDTEITVNDVKADDGDSNLALDLDDDLEEIAESSDEVEIDITSNLDFMDASGDTYDVEVGLVDDYGELTVSDGTGAGEVYETDDSGETFSVADASIDASDVEPDDVVATDEFEQTVVDEENIEIDVASTDLDTVDVEIDVSDLTTEGDFNIDNEDVELAAVSLTDADGTEVDGEPVGTAASDDAVTFTIDVADSDGAEEFEIDELALEIDAGDADPDAASSLDYDVTLTDASGGDEDLRELVDGTEDTTDTFDVVGASVDASDVEPDDVVATDEFEQTVVDEDNVEIDVASTDVEEVDVEIDISDLTVDDAIDSSDVSIESVSLDDAQDTALAGDADEQVGSDDAVTFTVEVGDDPDAEVFEIDDLVFEIDADGADAAEELEYEFSLTETDAGEDDELETLIDGVGPSTTEQFALVGGAVVHAGDVDPSNLLATDEAEQEIGEGNDITVELNQDDITDVDVRIDISDLTDDESIERGDISVESLTVTDDNGDGSSAGGISVVEIEETDTLVIPIDVAADATEFTLEGFELEVDADGAEAAEDRTYTVSLANADHESDDEELEAAVDDAEPSETESFGIVGAVDQVDTVTAEHDFVGIVADDEPLPVTAEGIADANGNVIPDGEVTVKIVRDGDTLVYDDSVDVTDGEINAMLDPEAIKEDEEDTGTAEVVIDEADDTSDEIELVHEVHDLDDGWNLKSIPQPAELHGENITAVNQWDAGDETYDAGIADDVISNAGDLHNGMYVDAADDDARLGYEFETDAVPEPGSVQLENGWHLASSNFAIDDEGGEGDTRDLDDDLVNLPDVDEPGITVFDDVQQTQLGGTSTVNAYDTYWIFIDDPESTDRAVLVPNYDPEDRASVLND